MEISSTKLPFVYFTCFLNFSPVSRRFSFSRGVSSASFCLMDFNFGLDFFSSSTCLGLGFWSSVFSGLAPAVEWYIIVLSEFVQRFFLHATWLKLLFGWLVHQLVYQFVGWLVGQSVIFVYFKVLVSKPPASPPMPICLQIRLPCFRPWVISNFFIQVGYRKDIRLLSNDHQNSGKKNIIDDVKFHEFPMTSRIKIFGIFTTFSDFEALLRFFAVFLHSNFVRISLDRNYIFYRLWYYPRDHRDWNQN